MQKIEIAGNGKANFGDFTVHASFIRLDNSFLLLVSDQNDYGIGTVTLSTPPTTIRNNAISSPFNLFGLKNTMLANLIGKTASKQLKSPVLSLILIKEQDIKPKILIKTAIEAINLAIKETISNN